MNTTEREESPLARENGNTLRSSFLILLNRSAHVAVGYGVNGGAPAQLGPQGKKWLIVLNAAELLLRADAALRVTTADRSVVGWLAFPLLPGRPDRLDTPIGRRRAV